MILEAMLQRLYASLQKGPSLNARPHHSRQRIDLHQLSRLGSVSVDALLPSLLGAARKATFPAAATSFEPPSNPEDEWSDEQRAAFEASDLQSRLLKKLQDIAIDATDYFNDHGENALFIGFPLVSLPIAGAENKRFGQNRILAPVAFIPVKLAIQRGSKTSVTLECAGDGADLLVPNPALLAWIEQQSGQELPELFEDDTGLDPAREFAEILAFVARNAGLDPLPPIGPETALQPIPKTEDLPRSPKLLPSAVLGLFPLTNPGLLRDTKHMIAEPSLLQGPVRAFLRQEALQAPTEHTPAPEEELDPAQPAATPRLFDDEFFVAPIDPCQNRTAAAARTAKALVIHGPPGTGKSQTITNIISDHLARGQRVLFVCDKRTAIDVVKHRLDHCGLGHLCGVIHDPTRDRQPLYLGLRDRMDQLVESEPAASPLSQLRQVNERLAALDQELKGYFRLLHHADPASPSFHQLVGQWLAFRRLSSGQLQLDPVLLAGVTLARIEAARTDIGEALLRAREAKLSENPFFERVSITLEAIFATSAAAIRERFAQLETLAASIDETAPEDPEPTQKTKTTEPNEAPAPAALADQPTPSPISVHQSPSVVAETQPPTPPLPPLKLPQEPPLPDIAAAYDHAADTLDQLATESDEPVCLRAATLDPESLARLRADLAAQSPLLATDPTRRAPHPTTSANLGRHPLHRRAERLHRRDGREGRPRRAAPVPSEQGHDPPAHARAHPRDRPARARARRA